MSTYDLCVQIWDAGNPTTLRKAKALVGETALTEGTLNVYYSRWRKAKGLTRRYRKRKGAEGDVSEERANE